MKFGCGVLGTCRFTEASTPATDVSTLHSCHSVCLEIVIWHSATTFTQHISSIDNPFEAKQEQNDSDSGRKAEFAQRQTCESCRP